MVNQSFDDNVFKQACFVLSTDVAGRTIDIERLPEPQQLSDLFDDIAANPLSSNTTSLVKGGAVLTKLQFFIRPLGVLNSAFNPDYLVEHRTFDSDSPRYYRYYIENSEAQVWDTIRCVVFTKTESFRPIGTSKESETRPVQATLHIGWQKNNADSWDRVVRIAYISNDIPDVELSYEQAYNEYPEARRSMRNFFNRAEKFALNREDKE